MSNETNIMARLRLQYAKDEIISDLYTYGMEWMYENSLPYTGPYHKYTTGEVYTEFNWHPTKSKKLIVYQDTNSPSYMYKQIKPNIKTKYESVNQYILTLTQQDYINGYIIRYFIKKVNSYTITEISKSDYDKYSAQSIDPNAFIVISLKWYITGNPQTTIVNGITIKGVSDKNIKSISNAEINMLGISLKLSNLLQYYTDTEYMIPYDINDVSFMPTKKNVKAYNTTQWTTSIPFSRPIRAEIIEEAHRPLLPRISINQQNHNYDPKQE